ncbi:MAG TPA: hypothetical protein ENK57_12000 [Polyangiaceae bacterium]|nr:hypothetical protein [Polyangiaceae bacterium]
MALFVILEDTLIPVPGAPSPALRHSGDLIDDSQYDTAALTANGVAFVAHAPAMDPIIAAHKAGRPNSSSLVALFLVAGLLP